MDAIQSADAAVSVETLEAPIRGAFNLRRFSGDATLVIGAALLANAFAYIFHFVLSRKLGPDLYGTLATMTAIAAMLAVIGSSIGTVVMQETARLWASHLDRRIPPFLRQTGRLVASMAVIISLSIGLLSIPLKAYLHVANVWLWCLLAVYVGIVMFAGFARGAAQRAGLA